MTGGLVLITGASRGIGAATARLCARDGWGVAVTYRADRDAADAVVDAIARDGGDAHAFQADVSKADEIPRLFEAVQRAMGLPTALVNNAGITGGIGPFTALKEADLRRVLDLNVIGTMLCSQHVARRWLAEGVAGSIVNVSSIAATTGSPHEYVHYAAAKAAVGAFTVGLGKELAAHGIRVNAIAPGTTLTGIHAAGGDPDRPRRMASRIPAGRAAEPEEVAESIVWLLSAKASYCTGTVLRVAGGV